MSSSEIAGTPRYDAALRGQVAVVTGAGRGIGRGGAIGLARRGARVALMDVTTDELERTAQMLRDEGAEVRAVRADLRLREEIDRALDDVCRAWGPPDVLVNNAAVLHLVEFDNTDPAVWDETLGVNLFAPYYLTWRAYPRMLERRRGRIITMSSRAGVQPFALETAYCAAKYALEGLFRSLALEATRHGVIITLGTPGRTTKPTSMTDAAFDALPDAERQTYISPVAFAEGFGYLAGAFDPALSGRRFDLFALAELVREHGYDLPAWRALQGAERNV